jgi:hypothetical protein
MYLKIKKHGLLMDEFRPKEEDLNLDENNL